MTYLHLLVSVLLLIGPSYVRSDEVTPISRCGTVIDRPGSYQLDRNLDCLTAGQVAITIKNTRSVKLSLGGRTITGPTDMTKVSKALEIIDSSDVWINATGALIKNFYTAITIDNGSRITLGTSIQNKLKMSPTLNAFSIHKVNNLAISSVIISLAPNLGLSCFNCNQFSLTDFQLGTSYKAGSQGIILGQVDGATLSMVSVRSTGKALDVKNTNNAKLSNVNIQNSTLGLILNYTENVTVENSKISGNLFGISMGSGPNTNLVLKDVTAEAPYATNALCRYQNSVPSNPSLINTTPSSVTTCMQ